MVSVKKIARDGSYIHVRFRQPGQFDGHIRTPEWASNVADDVSKGAKVRMGRTPAGTWLVQSVLIEPTGVRDKNHASSLAAKIRRKIEDGRG